MGELFAVRPAIRFDRAGDGRYGALRGDRRHMGTDYAMLPGSGILAPECGILGRYGYAYADDLQWRIVDYHGDSGLRYRFFYATQAAYATGSRAEQGGVIAVAQDITERYPGKGMTTHVHTEVFKDDKRIHPERV